MTGQIQEKEKIKKKLTFTLLISFTLLGALYFLAGWPALNKIGEKGEKIEEAKMEIERRYVRGQKAKNVFADLKEIEEKKRKLESILVGEENELSLITALEKTAEESGVKQKINLSPPAGEEKNISFRLITEGGFPAQLKYLDRLEALPYYLNIDSLELYPSEASAATPPNGEEETVTGTEKEIEMIIDGKIK